MARNHDVSAERIFSDRDDEGEEIGGFSGGIPYDEDEDEDGGWAINKDHSDSLWDSAEESDEDEEEATEVADAGEGEEEDPDPFGGPVNTPRRRGRRPAAESTGAAGLAEPVIAVIAGAAVGAAIAKGKTVPKPVAKSAPPKSSPLKSVPAKTANAVVKRGGSKHSTASSGKNAAKPKTGSAKPKKAVKKHAPKLKKPKSGAARSRKPTVDGKRAKPKK